MGLRLYLQNVLGLDIFISSLQETKPIKFFIYTPFAPSTSERELAIKIVNSIDILNAHFINQDEFLLKKTSEPFTNLLSDSNEHHFGISFGINPPQNLNTTWLELPAISQFIGETEVEKVNEVKRAAWAQLKIFKSKILKNQTVPT